MMGNYSNKYVTALHCLFLLIRLKWWSGSFRLHQVFPILMDQMLFSQIQSAPGPQLQKGKKIPEYVVSILSSTSTYKVPSI